MDTTTPKSVGAIRFQAYPIGNRSQNVGIYHHNVISLFVPSLSGVPSLPIVSDPSLFLHIFENTSSDEENQTEEGSTSSKDKRKPSEHHTNYTNEFHSHAVSGDQRLNDLCYNIVKEAFGWDNRVLNQVVFDHFKSNKNWRELGKIYQLERYSSYFHPAWMSARKNETDRRKILSDMWEALWDVIFEEREMFNDRLDGIYSIFQWLIARRYQLISHFSTNRMFRVPMLYNSPYKVSSRSFLGTDVDLNHDAVKKCELTTDKSKITCGVYVTNSKTLADQIPPKHFVSCYGVTKAKAISKALYMIKTGSKGTFTLIS